MQMNSKPVFTDASEIRLANHLLWVGKVVYENGFEFISVAESKKEAIARALNSESIAASKRPDFMPEIGGTKQTNTNNAVRIVGESNFIRAYLPGYIQLNYDVYLFVNREDYRDICLVAFDRNVTNIKPIYVSCRADSSLNSLKNCLYYFTAFIIMSSNNAEPELVQPTLYRWATNWVYRSTNIPLQTVLTRG
jgi:hypothetical protein